MEELTESPISFKTGTFPNSKQEKSPLNNTNWVYADRSLQTK